MSNVSVKTVYEKAFELFKNNKDYKKFLNNDFVLTDLQFYPTDYDIKFAIELYLDNNGPWVWEHAHDYVFLNLWLNETKYPLLQHPVSGNTIFHVNPDIISMFNLDLDLYSLRNFDDVPVKYFDLKNVNFI